MGRVWEEEKSRNGDSALERPRVDGVAPSKAIQFCPLYATTPYSVDRCRNFVVIDIPRPDEHGFAQPFVFVRSSPPPPL